MFGPLNESFRESLAILMKLTGEEEVSPIIVFLSVVGRMPVMFQQASKRVELVEGEQIPEHLFF